MGILSWLILGLIAGWIGSKIVNKTGEGFFLDIVLGIVGALVGGFLFSLVGAEGVSGLHLYSMFVAVGGAILGRRWGELTHGSWAEGGLTPGAAPTLRALPGGDAPNAGRRRRAIRS